jgi:hypothetical protein
MDVDRATDVTVRRPGHHRDHRLVHEISGVGSGDVTTQNPVRGRVDEDGVRTIRPAMERSLSM